MTAERAPEPDLLHQLDRDLAVARERAARAVDQAEALAELLSICDAVADSLGATSLTGEALLENLNTERERALALSLSDRAYPDSKPTKETTTR